jgi:rod shape-determining protein MreC
VSNTFDGIFPENVLVGTVEELSVNEADQFYQISIRLSTDFNALSTVYVIENTLREEQIELEGNVSE